MLTFLWAKSVFLQNLTNSYSENDIKNPFAPLAKYVPGLLENIVKSELCLTTILDSKVCLADFKDLSFYLVDQDMLVYLVASDMFDYFPDIDLRKGESVLHIYVSKVYGSTAGPFIRSLVKNILNQ